MAPPDVSYFFEEEEKKEEQRIQNEKFQKENGKEENVIEIYWKFFKKKILFV